MSIMDVKKMVIEMPENATIDDVIDKLIFAKQPENAADDIANGKV